MLEILKKIESLELRLKRTLGDRLADMLISLILCFILIAFWLGINNLG